MASPITAPAVVTLSREEMRNRALGFAKRWSGPQREEADAKSFLDEFFQIFGRDRHAVDAVHEYRVERPDQGEGRIDLLWPGKLLVEMKSTGRDLSASKGGAALQAFGYIPHIDPEKRPRWVMVSDFARFALYDLGEDLHEYLKHLAPTAKQPPQPVAVFNLEDLPQKLRHFAFIRDEEQALFQTQPEINQKAVALLGQLHDALKATGYTGHALERLLVRLLFCLFAEDTDIFPWNAFTRLVENSRKDGTDLGPRLGKLFETLNKDAADRATTLAEEYSLFPYVNGGLFAERLDLADTTEEHRAALLTCCRFDWSRISPGIFGSLFQGVMEPAERRAKGAHYTSEENIRRVIDPLFLDDLKAEFAKLKTSHVSSPDKPLQLSSSRSKNSVPKKRPPSPLERFHDRLSTLRFFDPACGCGNFLVVAYRELRALELEVLRVLHGDQLALGLEIDQIARINVDQFYGIELEEFPALIAETALWLTDHQVNLTFSKAFGRLYTRIPLKKSPTIVQGNALRLDWTDILPPAQCNYVLGNPPFVGKQYMSPEQNEDMASICGQIKGYGVLDYVTAWYVKTADYIQGTHIGCAFVSTNSISQGEQPAILWSHLFQKHLKIHFAHRTFVWNNEASGKAHVHVVVIGFGAFDAPTKRLYETDGEGNVFCSSGTMNLSPYLVPGGDVIVLNRKKPISANLTLSFGNMPNDGGRLILEEIERTTLSSLEPLSRKWIRPLLGPQEYINGVKRWCLWLVDANPAEIRQCYGVSARIEGVRVTREKSSRAATRELARFPSLFGEIRQPKTRYLAIPKTSSERREYIPMGFLEPDVIANADLFTCEGAGILDFGILTSTMHMAWMRTVAGRLKSDYRYSAGLVYNTFPWPEPNDKQRAAVEEAAQAVLDAREPHLQAGATLADLYDPNTMPANLLKAHQSLDRAVDKCYRSAVFTSERERVEFLFARYELLTAPLTKTAKPKKARRKSIS